MGIGKRLIAVLGGVTKDQLSESSKRAYESGFDDAGEDEPQSGALKKYGYRSLTGRGVREAKIGKDKALNVAWALCQSNPVVSRASAIKRDYIIGRGVKAQSEDEKLQAVLDDFWHVNRMDQRCGEFARQLFVFGVQCYPVFVRESDGRVKLGYIDPGDIEKVITDPENAMDMWAVIVKAGQGNEEWASGHGKQRVYRIVREAEKGDREGRKIRASQAEAGLRDWEPKMLAAHGLSEYSGDCFYTRVNAVSNQPFGVGDFLATADWLDQLDATLFALGEREQMAGYFSFDVTLKGASPAQVSERSSVVRRTPPKRGSVNVHNDSEDWEMFAPDLHQTGSVATTKELLSFILGGLGFPVSWYGRGDETNRATAQAQAEPTWRTLQHDQLIVKNMLLGILEFARDQAVIAGKLALSGDDGGEIDLQMPEMAARDTKDVAQSLAAIAEALLVAQEGQWMTRQQAAEVWAKIVSELGVEIEPPEIEEAAAESEEGIPLFIPTDWFAKHAPLGESEEERGVLVVPKEEA